MSDDILMGSERGHVGRDGCDTGGGARGNRPPLQRSGTMVANPGPDLERPLSAEPEVDNLLDLQVTMHDHFTSQKLVAPAAEQHFLHGKRVMVADPSASRRQAADVLFQRCGLREMAIVETGLQCLKSLTVSRRNFDSSPLAVDPAFRMPVACANFDFIFLAWDIDDPPCASVLESLLAFGTPVDGDMNARVQMPTVFVMSDLDEEALPSVAVGLVAKAGGTRPKWLNEATFFPLVRLPLQREAVEQVMASHDYVAQRLRAPISKDLLQLPDEVAGAVRATMADSDSGMIADHLYSLRRKLRASSARPTRITNSIREIQVAVEAADEAEEVFLEVEPAEGGSQQVMMMADDGDGDAPPRPLPYRMQGSRKLYTAKALLRRKRIRLNSKVIHGIRLFWLAVDGLKDRPEGGVSPHTAHSYPHPAHGHNSHSAGSSIGRDEFITFNIKVQKALSPDFQLHEAVLIAEADWDRDMSLQRPGPNGTKDVHPDIRKRRMCVRAFVRLCVCAASLTLHMHSRVALCVWRRAERWVVIATCPLLSTFGMDVSVAVSYARMSIKLRFFYSVFPVVLRMPLGPTRVRGAHVHSCARAGTTTTSSSPCSRWPTFGAPALR
jgi:hypothetical protein